MPTTSFVVRRLTVGPDLHDSRPFPGRGDFAGRVERMDGAVHEVNSEDLRLSSDEVVGRLAGGELRSTDLVAFDGTWTTLADSLQFADAAEPYARRERRARNLRSALILFVFIPGGLSLLWGLISFLVRAALD
jgi:hypothetical protein